MKGTALVVIVPLALVAGLVLIQKPLLCQIVVGKDQAARKPQAANPRIVESFGKLPLSFEANAGQADSRVKFISRGSGYRLFLTSTEAVLSLQKPPAKAPLNTGISPANRPSAAAKSTAILKMKLVGANPAPQLTGSDELPGKSNYFIGNDPAKWRTNVPNYAKVKYADVYPGIDLAYYGNQRQLEYDFVVSPGADPQSIRLAFDGDEKQRIDDHGDLALEAKGGEIRMHRPVVFQQIDGSRRNIAANFVLRSGREVGFEIARYDATKPLIIDPVLSYSTYLGGSGGDLGYGIAVDSSGNAYVTGVTASADFPTVNAFQSPLVDHGIVGHAFVTKLNADGSALVYSTYLGGNVGEAGLGIAVDPSGSAYVTGYTFSTNFPTANAFQTTMGGSTNAFLTKLNPAGSALVYSTYLGGTNFDAGRGIAVDSSGSAYVTGFTASPDFPTANAFQAAYGGYLSNAFVTKFNATGSALLYSTYLGGSRGGDYGDWGNGIAVDFSGNAYVTGYASSPDFPMVNAFQTANHCCDGEYTGDAFVTKLNPGGSAVYSTHLGGSRYDGGFGIAADSYGNAYVTGITYSADFPTANAFQGAMGGSGAVISAFVTKLNPDGSSLLYSTYLGGSSFDAGEGYGIAVDSSGNAYVTGLTTSIDFPTATALQPVLKGYENAFVTKLSVAGTALMYSTFLGGSGSDSGHGIALDASGNAYVTGTTCSYDFPMANAFQTVNANPNCAFNGGTGFVSKLTAFPAVPDPWQQAITAMKTAAGTDRLNFYQWAWYWQGNAPTFSGAPAGFGVAGSISPDLMALITAAGGGNPLLNISAEQWVAYYRSSATVVSSIVNAASHLDGPIAPGELVLVAGSGLGPPQAVTAAPDSNGLYPSQLAGTTVQVNGTPVPLLYTSTTEVRAVIPDSLAGATAQVTVTYQGQTSASFTVPAAPAAPGIFTVDSTGQGHAASITQNGSVNTPARWEGDVVTLFATGLGQAASGVTIQGYGLPMNPISVGKTSFPGVMQIKEAILYGQDCDTPVVIQVGNASSQPGVTIAIDICI